MRKVIDGKVVQRDITEDGNIKETIYSQTPDPRIYKNNGWYVPVEHMKDITNVQEAAKWCTITTPEILELKPNNILFEFQTVLSELELLANPREIALNYSPSRPRSWQKIVVSKIGKDITFVKPGDEVVLSELILCHYINIIGNNHSIENTHMYLMNRNKELETSTTFKKNNYYLLKEYAIGSEDLVLTKINY